MKSSLYTLHNTERVAIVLTALSTLALIVLTGLHRLWFAAGLCAITFILWVWFTLVRNRHLATWTNAVFSVVSTLLILTTLRGIALVWLIPILYCALTGWNLTHVYLRTIKYEGVEFREDLTRILKNHYQRLLWMTIGTMLVIMLVNVIAWEIPFGWTLLWLLIAGISVSYITRWIRNRSS